MDEGNTHCCICADARWLTICQDCYETSMAIRRCLQSSMEQDNNVDTASRRPTKMLGEVLRLMEKRKEGEQQLKERLRFVESFTLAAIRDGIHADILVKPGNGPSIPAHKALLASRSEILRTLLSSDECKAPAEGTISLPELTHDQLYLLLHFLYAGALPPDLDAGAEDVFALLLAADKYDVPYLRSFCEQRIRCELLAPGNALRVLELSEACSSAVLRECAMGVIAAHVEEIISSDAYEEFAAGNVHLSVEIARMIAEGVKTGDR